MTNKIKEVILKIIKEDDTEHLLFTTDVLEDLLVFFDDRISCFKEELSISSTKKDLNLLNKWKKLSKEAHNLLDPITSKKELDTLKSIAKKHNIKLPNKYR